ncbi:unnamed protein product [Mytilus coruscus]|uniref:Uncharacterized protein n=1 Tax=Mytilus coruscus TaxID=42192 RepID=A0A6J8B0Q8_MYTCO|nr:unnamed protein product [Mytilus coruscus]
MSESCIECSLPVRPRREVVCCNQYKRLQQCIQVPTAESTRLSITVPYMHDTRAPDFSIVTDTSTQQDVTGYVLKFVNNCQKKRPYQLRSSQGDRNLKTLLTKEEISLAMNLWIQDTQQDSNVYSAAHQTLYGTFPGYPFTPFQPPAPHTTPANMMQSNHQQLPAMLSIMPLLTPSPYQYTNPDLNKFMSEVTERLKKKGVPDDYNPDEDTEAILKDFIKSEIQIEEEINFHVVHRLKPKKDKSPRGIVAKVERRKDRNMVLSAAIQKLKNKKQFVVHEQYPIEIIERRRELVPILKDARTKGHEAVLKEGRLYIDKKRFYPRKSSQHPPPPVAMDHGNGE